MNWMDFIVSLLDTLAWPIVVITAVLVLQKPLAQLIPLLKRMKFKELEFEFSQELKAVNKKAVDAFPELVKDKKSLLIASSDSMPNSAVLESWQVVDEAAEKLIKSKRSDIDLNINTRYKLIQDVLVKGEIIDTKKGKLFNELRQLRNKVAHAVDYEVGRAEAIQYIELCFKLAEYLSALEKGAEQ